MIVGRPKGSKNKPKIARAETDTANISENISGNNGEKKKIGRPKGRKSSYTVTEKALAQRKDAGIKKVKAPETQEERDYNSRLIEHILQIHEIASHADRSDLLSLRSCFIAYLKLCQKNGFNVSNLSAYAAMGMDNPTFQNFSKKAEPEIKEFCRFIRETCAMFRENMVSNGKINPVIGIFWQRNFDGLRNDTEQVQSVHEQDDEFNGGNSYKEKYKNLIGG